MLRKKILGEQETRRASDPGEIDIAAVASVTISSEDPDHPIENAFDGRRGPGASYWMAAGDGEQVIVLAFDSPQKVGHVLLEVDENDVARSQEIQLLASLDGEKTYSEVIRQGFNFSPPGTTLEREQWQLNAERLTHLKLRIVPDTGGKPCRAKLTALVLS